MCFVCDFTGASSLSEPIAQTPAMTQTETHGVYPSAEFYAGVLEKQRSMAPAVRMNSSVTEIHDKNTLQLLRRWIIVMP